MTRGDKRTFSDKHKLYLLINFRIQGYGTHSLSALFHCDRVAIKRQCRRYFIIPQEDVVSIHRSLSQILSDTLPKNNFINNEGERINKGSTYKEYLNRYSPFIDVYKS